VAIFQHSLPFLQSESYQTHVGTIHRRAIGPFAHHNSTSAYSPSLACPSPDDRMSSLSTVQSHVILSQFPDMNLIFQPNGVRSQIHVCTRANSNTYWSTNQSNPEDNEPHNHRNARPLLRAQQCCLSTLLSANHAKAVQHCCVTKETQQCCTSAVL
jgi:hypothetical protein